MITAKLKKRPTLKAVVTKPYQGKGYADGYADGLEKGYTEGEADATTAYEAANAIILDDCNAVLPTKGASTAETLEQVPARIGEIVVTEDLLRLVSHPKFPGLGVFDNEEVVLNLDYAYTLDRMIYPEWGLPQYPNTKVKHLTVNCAQKIFGARQILCESEKVLEHLTLNADFSESTTALQMFSGAQSLKVIDGTPIDLSYSTNNANIFTNTPKVEEIRFAPNTIKSSIGLQGSSVLSDASIQSIIDGLAEVPTAQTLTLHATVGAKLTDAQKATITAKNWTLVY